MGTYKTRRVAKNYPFLGETYLKVIILAFPRRKKKTEMNTTDEESGTRMKGKCSEWKKKKKKLFWGLHLRHAWDQTGNAFLKHVYHSTDITILYFCNCTKTYTPACGFKVMLYGQLTLNLITTSFTIYFFKAANIWGEDGSQIARTTECSCCVSSSKWQCRTRFTTGKLK